MPYHDGAMEKKSGRRIRSMGRGRIVILNEVSRQSLAEKMAFEQRSEGGKKAQQAGYLGRACPQNCKSKALRQ